MTWIILWKRKNYKPSLDNIEMKHLFSLKEGKLETNSKPKDKATLSEYLHKKCNIEDIDDSDFTSIVTEFEESDGPNKFVRGKYELWFLVSFVISIYTSISTLSSKKKTKPPKMHVTLGYQNAVELIGPRAPIPISLRVFLKDTCLAYAQERESNAA